MSFSRFQALLVALVLLIITQPVVAEGSLPGYTTKILSLFVIVGAYRILRPHIKLLWTTAILFLVAAVAVPTDAATAGNTAHLVGALATVIALTITAVAIAIEAVREDWVTRDTLLGAVAVYLLIGITATYAYEAIEILAPGSFTNLHGMDPAQIFGELNYFSLVTLTTLGYGDIAPVAPTARVLATMEAIVGQFFVAAVVGLLISRGGTQRRSTKGPDSLTENSSNPSQD